MTVNYKIDDAQPSWANPTITYNAAISCCPYLPKPLSHGVLSSKMFLDSMKMVLVVQTEEIESGKYAEATESWRDLERYVSINSNSADFYNFLLDAGNDPVSSVATALSDGMVMKYSSYLSSKYSSDGDTYSFMNGVIRQKLKIIPKNVIWGDQSNFVFDGLQNDFMKPRINEVDELLFKGVNVTVYSGQVPVDQPCLALKMLAEITQSPAPTSSKSNKGIPAACY
ncbi:hypothetical protein ACLOJK_025937 [Asimina triloba]